MAENEFIRERNEFIRERIIEGICPTHASPLERRRDCGWCVDCGCGYSLGPEHLTLHTEFTLSDPASGSPSGSTASRRSLLIPRRTSSRWTVAVDTLMPRMANWPEMFGEAGLEDNNVSGQHS